MTERTGENWSQWTEGERNRLVSLLQALDRQVSSGRVLAEETLSAVVRQHFLPYNHFRRQFDEAMAVIVVLEEILLDAKDARADMLRAELRRLVASLITLYVETARSFFGEMSRSGAMPMAARHLFSTERASLDQARQRLSSAGNGSAEALSRLVDEADQLLEDIIDRAPYLPDFETEPPLEPEPKSDLPSRTVGPERNPMSDFGWGGWMP